MPSAWLIGVVNFGGPHEIYPSEVLLSPTRSLDEIRAAADRIEAAGGTPMAAGLENIRQILETAPPIPSDDSGETARALACPVPCRESHEAPPEDVDSGKSAEEPSPPTTEPKPKTTDPTMGLAEPGAEGSLAEVSQRLEHMERMLDERLAALEKAVGRLAVDAGQRDEPRRNREAIYEKLEPKLRSFGSRITFR